MSGIFDVTLAIGNTNSGDRVLLLSILMGTDVPVDKLLYCVKDRLISQFSNTVGFKAWII